MESMTFVATSDDWHFEKTIKKYNTFRDIHDECFEDIMDIPYMSCRKMIASTVTTGLCQYIPFSNFSTLLMRFVTTFFLSLHHNREASASL